MAKLKGKPKGRPSTLTDELKERIVARIAEGNYIEVACRACGVPESTYHSWLQYAKKQPGSAYSAFAEAVDEAEAIAECDNIAFIHSGGGKEDGPDGPHKGKNWQHRAWLAERKSPERWGQKARVDLGLGNKDGKPLQIQVIEIREGA